MNPVKWTDTRLNGRLWSSQSDDGRWYIEHLDLPGTPWGVFYCAPREDGTVEELVCEAARLGSLRAAKACVESGQIVDLTVQTLRQQETYAARTLARSTDNERRASDAHETARSRLAAAIADLHLRQST